MHTVSTFVNLKITTYVK